jgi:hypothetical protein
MKTLIPLATLATLAASSSLYAQAPVFSKPSGYTTQVMKPSLSNSVGFNILTPALAAGAITAVSGDGFTLTDSTANFTSILPINKMCTIEITSGAAVGAVREFNSFNGTSVSISAAISDLAIGDKYIIRKNATVQEIFPLGSPLTGAEQNPDTADIVWVPDGNGGYTKYWYKTSDTEGPIGWWTTEDGATPGVQVTQDIPLLYTDGITVQRKSGSNNELILEGQVKTTASTPYILTGFNDVSINSPAGSTLFNAGFAPGPNFLGAEISPENADILLVPDGNGGFSRYWYKTSENQGAIGWWTTEDGTTRGAQVTEDVVLPPNCTIQRKGVAKFMKINVSSVFSDL